MPAHGLTQAIVLIGAATIAAGFAFDRWRRGRWLVDTPVSKVRSAAQGYVELNGEAKALPGDPVLAPLTGRTCVWWHYQVEERTESRNGNRGWRVIERGSSESIFALDDGTGQAVIDPRGADVNAPDRETWNGDTPRPPLGMPNRSGAALFANNFRYTEQLILPGQTLCAIGQLKTERIADGMASVDLDVAAKLHAWKQDRQRMAEFDRDHDGQLSAAEWEAARQQARAEVLSERAQQEAIPGITMLVRPGDGRPFLLGTGNRTTLASRYRLSAGLYALAAVGGLSSGLFLLSPFL